MKMTLLEMVTDILSDMESDAVTSITDTFESQAVAGIIKRVYFEIIENETVPELDKLFRLTTHASNAVLQFPTTMEKLYWVKYDKKLNPSDKAAYSDLQYLLPKDFIELCNARDNTDTTNNETMAEPGGSGISLTIAKLVHPTYWTSFDDEYLIVDAYNGSIDSSGIDNTKTQAFGKQIPTWTVSDSFTPTLGSNLFNYLLSEAKTTCFAVLKQELNPKLERQSNYNKGKLQNDRYRFKRDEYRLRPPNYGRK